MAPRSTAARAVPPRATRDVILDAAERCFAERGFAAVSMRELASAAGLKNQASLYNHFRNKRALYEAVLGRGVEPILAVIDASAKAGVDLRALAPDPTAFMDVLLDYLIEHPHLPRLLQRAALDDSRYLRNTLARLLKPIYTQGVEVLAASGDGWERGELPHVAAGLYLLIFGYFANTRLLEAVIGTDPLGPTALARQRRFLRTAIQQVMAGGRTLQRRRP